MCLERMRGMMGGVRICCFIEGYEGVFLFCCDDTDCFFYA